MMTKENIGMLLDILEANYGQKFYDGVDKDNVLNLWTMNFRNDDPELVLYGVQCCINTMRYKPTIADVREFMAKKRMKGQMTEIEAFQTIKSAVNKSKSKELSYKAFNELPAICRKIVVNPSQLWDWRVVSEESFETVVASMITRTYRSVAEGDAEFYALPEHLQREESWHIEAPEQVALPEAKKPETMTEILDRMDAEARAYREKYGITPKADYSDKVSAFKAPLTEEDKKRVELREKQKAEWSLK